MHGPDNFLGSLWAVASMSFYMGWEMFWALVLGLTLSAVVQAVVTKAEMSKWLADNSFKSLSIATLSGAASSSCSYAAAAIARALIKQGADFNAAMAFQFASTNLVIELSILLAILLGWQFTLAQFIGGIVMIAVMSIIFRYFVPKKLIDEAIAKAQIDTGTTNKTAISVSANKSESLLKRILSEQGKTAISHYFFMDWAALWTDIVIGIFIAGILCVFVPDTVWSVFFCKNNYQMAQWIGPLVGPLIAVLSFVCSIGNVPMAAVLWHQGMSFGGVLSFLFADLLVLPLLDIYRKYYGNKMAGVIAVSFYISMVIAAYFCQWLFFVLRIYPVPNSQIAVTHGAVFYYTSILNIIAIIFSAVLFIRFQKTGGMAILREMNKNIKNNEKSCCHH
jgi:uncharacterized membrane protein YraQ (UPF0718 family)